MGFKDKIIDTELSPCLLPVDHGTQRYSGGPVREAHIRHLRKKVGIVPVVKQIDTLAAEYPAETPLGSHLASA